MVCDTPPGAGPRGLVFCAACQGDVLERRDCRGGGGVFLVLFVWWGFFNTRVIVDVLAGIFLVFVLAASGLW